MREYLDNMKTFQLSMAELLVQCEKKKRFNISLLKNLTKIDTNIVYVETSVF